MGTNLFTSESVTEGHPDKMADRISDGVLDAVMSIDPMGRVACETLVSTGLVVLSGEIRTTADLDVAAIARKAIREIGYCDDGLGFSSESCAVMNAMGTQSLDIALGVDNAVEARVGESTDEHDLAGAGDQGMMFGYASNETQELMPMPISLAHAMARRLAEVRKDGSLPYLRPDGKTQVTVEYVDGKPVAVRKVLISAQHRDGESIESMRKDLWEHVVTPTVPGHLFRETDLFTDDNFMVNPTGRFVTGGPTGDCGLTGRKIIVDTYGGMSRHGGGAFSGKDPSKVDRSGAYMARYVAKNVVAAGLAERAEVQLAYAIGIARPVSVMVETFGTEAIPTQRIADLVMATFDLRPGAYRMRLDLHRPIYSKTSAYGHFGRSDADFTWEATTMADALASDGGVDRPPLA